MKCECGECSRCEFAARVAAANGSRREKKPRELRCTKCDTSMGIVRTGQGRQREFCGICFKENRRENGKKQDAKRKAARRAVKLIEKA